MMALQLQQRAVGERTMGGQQTDLDRAVIRLTGQPHTLYRPVNSLVANRQLYQTVDGRRFVYEHGECRWV